MTKTVLNDVLDLLIEHQLVSSESEFSKDWLGRSESYLRVQRFHNEPPSIGSVATCASKLQHYGKRLSETGRHDALSDRFIELSDACHRYINMRCEDGWLQTLEKGSAAKNIRCPV